MLCVIGWDSVCAPSQWGTTSQCDVVPHWLGARTKLSLLFSWPLSTSLFTQSPWLPKAKPRAASWGAIRAITRDTVPTITSSGLPRVLRMQALECPIPIMVSIAGMVDCCTAQAWTQWGFSGIGLTVKFTLDISGAPIDFQWGSRKFLLIYLFN